MAAMSEKNGDDAIVNAEEIIERFGGIRPMASKMDVPVTTVQGWKKRNVIPANRRDQVLRAAQSNDIDVSDLIAGAANENAFSAELDTAVRTQSSESERRHEDAVIKATRREPPVSSKSTAKETLSLSNNEQMFNEIKQAQSMAFTKSVWFTTALVAAVVLISAMLLWPSKEQIEKNGQDIASLNGEVEQIKSEGGSLFKKFLPANLEERLSEVREQTQNIQQTVAGLSTELETIKQDVMAPNVPVSEKIHRVEEHITRIAGPSQLTEMLQKVQTMQASLEGQTQLSSAIADLNMLFQQNQSADDAAMQQALQQAQSEDDALGEALQDVAPQDLKAAALLLGMAQFRSSLHRNAPFEEDLALMQKLVGEDDAELQAAITRLAPKADEGVLTPEGLKGEFKGLAGDIVVASLKGEEVSVQEKAKARFNDILQVEKDGELLTGTDTQAKVLRAQKMLDEGDVQGAIAELQSLEGEAATAAQPFIDEAQLSMLAEQLQGMFAGKVMNRLGGGVGGMNITAGGAGIEGLMQEVQKLAPRRVIRSEGSNLMILEPKPKFTP